MLGLLLGVAILANCNQIVAVTITAPASPIIFPLGHTLTISGFYTDDGGVQPCDQRLRFGVTPPVGANENLGTQGPASTGVTYSDTWTPTQKGVHTVFIVGEYATNGYPNAPTASVTDTVQVTVVDAREVDVDLSLQESTISMEVASEEATITLPLREATLSGGTVYYHDAVLPCR